jgi:hypothetical protein
MPGEANLSEEEIQLCRKAFGQFDKDGAACRDPAQAAVEQQLSSTEAYVAGRSVRPCMQHPVAWRQLFRYKGDIVVTL